MKFGAASFEPYVSIEGPGVRIRRDRPKTPGTPTREESVDSGEPLTIEGVVFPREASTAIRAMDAETRARWDADRYKCLTDQLFLSEVLGLDLVENPHRALFNLFLKKQPGAALSSLDERIKKRLVLWPRGCAKTFSVRVEEAQLILNYPNIRICFLTGSDDLAKRQLAALKNVFRRPTAQFKYLFPEFCVISKQKRGEWSDVAPDWGNAHEFNVPARGDSVLPEPTFCISTARSINSGSHFDVIVIDDLVNDRNWQSSALLEKSYQDYLSLCPLLDPQGFILMTGTRYAIGDCYERIRDTAVEMKQDSVWKFSIRDCWSTGCLNCPHPSVFHEEGACTADNCHCQAFASDGQKGLLFPQVVTRSGIPFGHTMKFLQTTLAELKEKFFSCQYLNDPLADGTQTFTQALIDSVTLTDESQLPPPGIPPSYLMGDLAYSTSSERDESVIFAFQKYNGALYVWGCWAGRWSANDRVENILKILNQVRPETAFFEKNLNSDSLHLNLIARAPEFGLAKLPIEWVPTSNVKDAKNARIGDIEMAMKGKRLFLYSKMKGYDLLVQQLLKFPNLKFDDRADCLALVVAAPTRWQYDSIPQPPTSRNWLHKLHSNEFIENAEYPDSGAGSGIAC